MQLKEPECVFFYIQVNPESRSSSKTTEMIVKLKNLALAILQYQRKSPREKRKKKTNKQTKKPTKKPPNNFPSPTNRKGEGGIPPHPQYSI